MVAVDTDDESCRSTPVPSHRLLSQPSQSIQAQDSIDFPMSPPSSFRPCLLQMPPSTSVDMSSSPLASKVPPKRLKLLKRYARTNFEEERPAGRGSSGFAAVQMTIDSECGETIDESRDSPPLPDSPTSVKRIGDDDDDVDLRIMSPPPSVAPSPLSPPPRPAPHTHPTTCIVIQQASICGNSPDGDESDDMRPGIPVFADVENNNLTVHERRPSQPPLSKREENMRLLEVATTLTEDQLHEFDKKYGSPHHSRSQSMRPRARPTFLSLPQARTRVASMPNTGAEEHYYRLRHFSIAGKSIVNKGDSLKARKPRSRESIVSETSSGQKTSSRQSSVASGHSSDNLPSTYKVIMLGASDVGKTSLISQFMTSEFLNTYDNSIDDEFGEKSVSVLLDGEESEIIFVDHPSSEMSPTACFENYKSSGTHGYCVVYSASDFNSFKVAEDMLQALWKDGSIRDKAVILVANKTDLVRSRVITNQEGKHLATSYDTKYIETSVGFNHNVDELLVGLLSQIRLKMDRKAQKEAEAAAAAAAAAASSPPPSRQPLVENLLCKTFPKTRNARLSASLKVKGLLSRVWLRDSKSKSCENLHVL